MSDHEVVTMPADTFAELQNQASNYTPPTAGQRVAGTAQALLVLSAVASIVPVASYAWVRCQDWLDERRLKRTTSGTNLTSVK